MTPTAKDGLNRTILRKLFDGLYAKQTIAFMMEPSAESRQQRSLQLLRQSLLNLHESEKSAQDSVQHLHQQREQLLKVHQNVHVVDNGISKSNWLVRKMTQWWRS
jgi:hypothetical protein